jgi:hypothetical protein
VKLNHSKILLQTCLCWDLHRQRFYDTIVRKSKKTFFEEQCSVVFRHAQAKNPLGKIRCANSLDRVEYKAQFICEEKG